MTPVSPAMRDLTRRIFALETLRGGGEGVTARVCLRLQVPLSKLIGFAGFSSLLKRALVLARAEVTSLDAVSVASDGSLAGWDDAATEGQVSGPEILVAHFLALLATFIGEPLTQRLTADAWPDSKGEASA